MIVVWQVAVGSKMCSQSLCTLSVCSQNRILTLNCFLFHSCCALLGSHLMTTVMMCVVLLLMLELRVIK